MKWILIYFAFTVKGATTGSVEFNSYDACDKAVEMVETAATNDWTRESIAFCVSKGRE